MIYQFDANSEGLYDPAYEKDSCGVACIADISGKKSNTIVQQGLEILLNMEHRGATGSDPLAGDGAGILLQISDDFFQSIQSDLDFVLPKNGKYAVALCFMPQDAESMEAIKNIIETKTKTEQLVFLGWREVPTNNQCLSKNLLQYEPAVLQFFIENQFDNAQLFERKLFILRRQIEKAVLKTKIKNNGDFHICSLSHRTIVYKGMFIAPQLGRYYLDLQNPNMKSALAIVHQRYSTNTFPAWKLAQPFRFLAHNGEINTIQSNTNWAHSREAQLQSNYFGQNIKKLFPIIQAENSDSASYDNYLELLLQSGRSLENAMTIMTPEAWENDQNMDENLRAYYKYNQCLMEPWDGPASLIFSDGIKIGALLDRNGLRPISVIQSHEGLIVMASESGVLRLHEANIKLKRRLGSGEICVVDTEAGEVLFNDAIKTKLAKLHPYKQWVAENIFYLKDLQKPPSTHKPSHHDIRIIQRAFRFTYEQIHLLVKPMADHAEETTYSMGTDTPLAVLSKNDKPFYSYFKQRFAQVTNPAIDSIREDYVMSLNSLIGGNSNLLNDNASNCRVLSIEQPVLSNDELEQLRNVDYHGFRSITVSMTYDIFNMHLEKAIDQLNEEVESCVDSGYQVIILSDRNMTKDKAPIPALLATSAVHHYLIRKSKRGKIGLIIESGDVREVHHFACLIGYGAGAINPYLIFDSISDMFVNSQLECKSLIEAKNNYIKAVQKGLKKIFAKMGISSLLSYQGAQIFESVGIDSKTVKKYFTGTSTRIEGIGLDHMHRNLKIRHKRAYNPANIQLNKLITGGEYNWRQQGEYHAYNPKTVHLLQQAAWHNDQAIYDQFSEITNEHEESVCSIRGLFHFNSKKLKPIALDQVEPASEIIKRFSTGAMSIGSISKESHETLAIAMNRIGGKSNTGEGGEDPARFEKDDNGDLRRSAIKQVASGRFGVTSHYLVNADELQIKIAQGAKPGEGGQLPGLKVNDYIAKLRHTIPGVTLISPPPHHDIYSIEDLSQLIFDLKNANTKADISVKLVSANGIGTVAAGVVKAKADSIVVAGYDGGTGASPATSIKHAGIPWEIGLAETQQTLMMNNLRSQVRIQIDGQLKTGRDVVIGGMLGADEFGFATAALIATGCIMMRKCHLNTCPVGIATQNPELRKLYHGKPEYVVNYFMFVAEEVRKILAQLGFRKFSDIIGQTDLLESKRAVDHWKAGGLDFSKIFYKPKSQKANYYNTTKQKHGIDKIKDHELIKKSKQALENQKNTRFTTSITNADRTVGTMLGSVVSQKYGVQGLPEDCIKIDLIGTAGQSLGAFIPKGVTLRLFGDANDYVGKGLSGGKIIVSLSPDSKITSHQNYIAGNTALYGATSGKAFFAGIVGQRFCVRNSGAIAVVEGAGNHCCEYMTGGIFISLGKTGRNFAAGMSGGIAYVYDKSRTFRQNCNTQMVEIEDVYEETKMNQLHALITEHYNMTNSKRAEMLLGDWDRQKDYFVCIIPYEYRTILEQSEKQKLAV